MLVFLVLCAFLGTLRGPPLISPSSVATFDLMAREVPAPADCGGRPCRAVDSILQSCLLTIFACVWTSAHPNINGPCDSDWACLKRKVVTMLCAVLAPELVLCWALRQHLAAKKIAEMYNKTFAGAGEMKTSLWEDVVGWFVSLWHEFVGSFQRLPKETTWRGDGQLWTITHGFFIQMGCFILYDGGYPKEVLDYERLAELIKQNDIEVPTVTERDLQDRSKGDGISKAIIVLQTTWFVAQCIVRACQRLPLSQLEVLTLSFAVVNWTIYAVWWNKPQGVGMAICVPLKKAQNNVDASSTPLTSENQHGLPNLSRPETNSLPGVDYRLFRLYDDSHVPSGLPLPHKPQPDEPTTEKPSWLRRNVQKDLAENISPFFLVFRFPYLIVRSVIRTADKIGEPVVFNKKDLRVPMFFASELGRDELRSSLPSCAVGVVFGAIHLLAWASEFHSHRDLVLWRISASLLTLAPISLILGGCILWLFGYYVDAPVDKPTPIALYLSFILLTPFYIASRFVVIVVALRGIRHPPHDVLLDISWTSRIPHY